MANSIFETVQNNQQNQVAQQFTQFMNGFMANSGGMRPEQLGPQLVSNGTIPQNQFEQFRQIANKITGLNK